MEFFKRVYLAAVSPNFYASYNDRFKALFQEVKTRLIQRGLLVFGLLPDTFLRGATILERRRFRFPEDLWRVVASAFPTAPTRPGDGGAPSR